MTTTRLDWTPVVRSFLVLLAQADVILVSVDDSGVVDGHKPLPQDPASALEMAIDAITAVDNAALRIAKDGTRATLWFVLDGEPAEILVDWTVPKDSPLPEIINHAVHEHTEQWDGKPVPRVQEAA